MGSGGEWGVFLQPLQQDSHVLTGATPTPDLQQCVLNEPWESLAPGTGFLARVEPVAGGGIS